MSLSRTYRPVRFSDVVGQQTIVQTIRHQVTQGTVGQAYLFSGPRGVGKTTMARLIARSVNCTKRDGADPCNACEACQAIATGSALDVIEIDAASHTGVDHVREQIIEQVRFAPVQLARKVFIIDEVHMLSKGAFNALLKTLEEPPAGVVFVLATTERQKIPDTIASRCQRFVFQTIPESELVERLASLAEQEQREVDVDVLQEIARRSDGCVRDAESLLSQVLALEVSPITKEAATALLSIVPVETVCALLNAYVQQDPAQALTTLHAAFEQGQEPGTLLREFLSASRQLLLARYGARTLGAYSSEQWAALESAAQDLEPAQLKTLVDACVQAQRTAGQYQIPMLPLELLCVTLCTTSQEPSVPPAAPKAVQEVEPVHTVARQQEKKGPAESVTTQEQAPPVPVSVDSAISLERVQKLWPKFLKAVQDRHASLPLALESAEVLRVEESRVTIRTQFEFYAETVNQPKNNHFLSSVLSEVASLGLQLQAVFANVTTQEEDVQNLLNAFGGQVVEAS